MNHLSRLCLPLNQLYGYNRGPDRSVTVFPKYVNRIHGYTRVYGFLYGYNRIYSITGNTVKTVKHGYNRVLKYNLNAVPLLHDISTRPMNKYCFT